MMLNYDGLNSENRFFMLMIVHGDVSPFRDGPFLDTDSGGTKYIHTDINERSLQSKRPHGKITMLYF